MNAPFARHPHTGRVLPDLTQSATPALSAALARRGRPTKAPDDAVRRLFASGLDDDAIAAELGCSRATVLLRRRALKLLRRQRRDRDRPKERLSRHAPKTLDDRIARMPPINHPALTEARTLYPGSVVPVAGLNNALVSGANAWKIGERIAKGAWRGFPVFTLTLEERATCPVSCAHWRSCYGNGMNWAKRIAPGPELEERLRLEVGLLSQRNPAGFAVRLHVLGDFYSVAYVDLWRALIERHPNLHVFGFSARSDLDDRIGLAVTTLIVDHWPRFAVRLSNAPYPVGTTITIEHPLQRPADAIVCPQQTGRTASCSTCALCWSTDRRIAFLRH